MLYTFLVENSTELVFIAQKRNVFLKVLEKHNAYIYAGKVKLFPPLRHPIENTNFSNIFSLSVIVDLHRRIKARMAHLDAK